MEETSHTCTLLMMELNPDGSSLPPEYTKFQNIIPKEIPSGLLLMRGIQHCIDHVSSAILPNKATYIMSLKEHKKLWRQVNELVAKTSEGLYELLYELALWVAKTRDDLVPIPTTNWCSSDAEAITRKLKKMHAEVCAKIEKSN